MNRMIGCVAIVLGLVLAGCSRDLIPPMPAGPPSEPTTTPYSLLVPAPGEITWERSGGFAGLCQELVIWSDGGYALSEPCRSSERLTGTLLPSELDQLQAWLATYQTFDWTTPVPPGSADMFVDHLVFKGAGEVPAPAGVHARMSDYIGGIVSRLMIERTPSPSSVSAQQGIQGTAVMGPMCPVMRDDNSCPDKPYQGTLQVLDAGGKVVANVTTASDGTFSVELPPGKYSVQGVGGAAFPRAPRMDVTVAKGQFTQVQLTFDTGIR